MLDFILVLLVITIIVGSSYIYKKGITLVHSRVHTVPLETLRQSILTIPEQEKRIYENLKKDLLHLETETNQFLCEEFTKVSSMRQYRVKIVEQRTIQSLKDYLLAIKLYYQELRSKFKVVFRRVKIN